ncbi:hypothetical protein B0H13DRAFT_1882021 [Mycena leptocephala]|nr:hypothetical protein B0H13DRAFT_1882021 [Mycena leptocephala]
MPRVARPGVDQQQLRRWPRVHRPDWHRHKCYVSGGALRVDSMAWNHAANKRGSEAIAGTVQPDSFKLVVEGVHKVARIPAKDGALKAMVAFFNAGNFTGLEAFGLPTRTASSVGALLSGITGIEVDL